LKNQRKIYKNKKSRCAKAQGPASLFAWLISHQPAVLFSHNKPATSNQSAVLFSQNKPASAISHQPNEQADAFYHSPKHAMIPRAAQAASLGKVKLETACGHNC
jgi:hypothetical protein